MQIVRSYANENAVKVVAFAMNFLSGLSQQEINALIDTIENDPFFKENFEKFQKSQEVSLTIQSDGIPKHEQSIGGLVCENTNPSGNNIGWNLTINKNFLVTTCKVYTRWSDVRSKAIEFIDRMFTLVNNSKEISQVTLEYLDEFEILNVNDNWKAELFRSNCNYILPNIYQLDDFWHINHGYFIKLENLEQKLLDTLNINYFADEQDNMKRKVNIAMQHVLLGLNQAYSKADIQNLFDIIHTHSKQIFESIINETILEKFGDRVKK